MSMTSNCAGTATRDDWSEVWTSFDRRKKAGAGAAAVANEDEGEVGGLFGHSVAAE